MTAKQPRNREGLTLREWFCAAGWELLLGAPLSRRNADTWECLAAGWTNGADPAEYLSCAPKSIHDLNCR